MTITLTTIAMVARYLPLLQLLLQLLPLPGHHATIATVPLLLQPQLLLQLLPLSGHHSTTVITTATTTSNYHYTRDGFKSCEWF